MTNYIAAFIDELGLLGLKHVVISPGSRSTPLSMTFCEGNFKTHMIIDERSAGFFALGIAKELNEPVALVCTSGTAASNYLPAVTEASISNVPLIVLTSDRPHELRNVGAPQAINQNNMYGNFVKEYEELALPEENKESYKYVRTVADRLYTKSIIEPAGVVHINVPLRDPLVPKFKNLDFTSGRRKYSYTFNQCNRECSFDSSIFDNKKVLILCGADSKCDYFDEVISLAERIKAPILADPISNFRSINNLSVIHTYDSILKNEKLYSELKPDCIIHFGGVMVSKRLNNFIKNNEDIRYFKISQEYQYVSQTLSITDYIMVNEKLFCNSIEVKLNNSNYIESWIKLQKKHKRLINSIMDEETLFEGKIVKMIEKLAKKNTRLFAANSMEIRYIDSFYNDEYKKNIKILCNRGANGIDGVVSSAIGVSKVSDNTILFIGDLSLYHDLNGLLAGKMEDSNLVIVLVNNDGGGIFRFLPQSGERNFEYLFLTQHGINFEGVSQLYEVQYSLVNSYAEFEERFVKAINSKGINLIEVRTDSIISKQLNDKYTNLGVL